MKKLLRLLVATLAFFAGIFAAKIYLVKYQFVSVPPIEAVKVEELQTNKIDVSKPNNNEENELDENNYEDNQGIFGWYSLDYSKKMPEVNMILLSGDYKDLNPNLKMIASSGVFTTFENYGDQGFVEDAWTIIEDNKVKFKSKKIKGIEYRFKGFFFKNKTSGENGEKVLRGTLQKYIKDKKVAEVSGDFAYYEPHCWH